MRADLALLGNDVHAPQQEMAAHLVENLRRAFDLPHSQVFSIQSRKSNSGDGSRLIKKLPRPLQLCTLLAALAQLPRKTALLYVGNANPTLLRALSAFSALRRQRFGFYPLGNVALPLCRPHVLWLPHEEMIAHYQKQHHQRDQIAIVPPFPHFQISAGKRQWMGGKMLFASVPPHAHEFRARGLPQLFEAVQRANRSGIPVELTVLNRYPRLHRALEELRSPFGATITIRSEVVNDVPKLLEDYDLLVTPSGDGPLPQLPLSALEALSLGIPVLAHRSLALATDLHHYQAGALFDSPDSIVAAVRAIRDEYATYSSGARRLATERYSSAAARPQLELALRLLIESELR